MTTLEILQYLYKFIPNVYGLFGLAGNLYKESGILANNLQNTGNVKLGMTDAQFTAALDSGAYTKDQFINDRNGYGLAQWTSAGRKKNLYEHIVAAKTSFGDAKAQCDFLVKEMKSSYSAVWKTLLSATSIQEASDMVLMKFEIPANAAAKKAERAKAGQDLYDQYAASLGVKTPVTPSKGGTSMGYTNSPLATYTLLSPNHSGQRNHIIDRITPHCFVGQVTSKRGAEVFQPSSKQASCQYVIGKDGDISLVCEEKNRSWCTSSGANDHRAITIEVASDSTHPYAITTAAYEALIKLCADICRRNGKKRVTWLANKEKSINYAPAADEMLFTVHRWFAAKACPGDYIYNHLPDIAARVNKLLGSATVVPTTTQKPGASTTPTQNTPKKVTAAKAAQEKDLSLRGTYKVTAVDGLHVRSGASTKYKSLVVLPYNTKVQCYGYYTEDTSKAKWLYVQVTYNGVIYTGFCHSAYLTKV